MTLSRLLIHLRELHHHVERILLRPYQQGTIQIQCQGSGPPAKKALLFSSSTKDNLAQKTPHVYSIPSLSTQPAAHPLCLWHGDSLLAWTTSPHSLSLIGPHPHSSLPLPPLPSIATQKYNKLKLGSSQVYKHSSHLAAVIAKSK
jgi:hypothetical protein